MGFNFDVSMMISSIKECFESLMPEVKYDGNKVKAPGVLYTFDFRINDNRISMKSIQLSRIVHILLVYPHAVFISEKNDYVTVPEDFRMTSNHNSCYKSDGIWTPVSKIYFDMCEKINHIRKGRHMEELSPIEMDSNAYIWKMKMVTVDLVPDPDNPDGYWKKIERISIFK